MPTDQRKKWNRMLRRGNAPRVLGPHNTRSGMARSAQKAVYSVSVGSGLVVVERLVAMNSLTLPKSLGNSDDTVGDVIAVKPRQSKILGIHNILTH
ncbi:hypothetical protein ACI3KW_00535 [Devosia sp. ZW T5_3]|uniref:hypothetical protein n=1 Tax=Devosia sp. ZW T5_3 TaxID=3378085 RepID=UPI003854B4AA